MDQKAWLWKKKSSEKTIVANGKADLQMKGNVEEDQLPNEKEVALEKSVKILNDRLTSLLGECNVREEELASQAKIAQEAMTGKEKAEAEVLLLRKDLEDALQEKFAANERISCLNAALKECMQQLNSIREEREQRVQDAIMRTSEELERAHHRLEEKLSESSKKIANLTVENAHLSKTLVVKEALVEELTNQRSQVEAEFDALMSRLDSVEKENAFLRYEHRMLEKDLDIKNEEIEFSRHSTEASEKQLLESVKKIKRLEAECQRLRVLVRKRIPGSLALANIKPEVEVLGRYNTETRRRKLNSKGGEDSDISNKRINFLVERLQSVEQENKSLRDVLANKEKDSKPSNVGTETEGHHKPMDLTLSNTLLNELSTISSFDSCEELGSNSSRSRASAIAELQNFRDSDSKGIPENHMIENSEMSLMDDFIEMEKLAIVAVDGPNKNSHASSDTGHVLPDSSKSSNCLNDMDSTGKELVPIGNNDLNNMNQELQINDTSSQKHVDWLQTVVKVITEQVCVSQRSIDELLEDIRFVFQSEAQRDRPSPHSQQNELLPISCYIAWKSPATSPGVDPIGSDLNICSSREENYHESVQCISSSIGKILGLIRRFDSSTIDRTVSSNQLTADEDYAIHVFGWKKRELVTVVHRFIQTCDLLLSRTIDFEKFAAELSSTLGWILEKCIKNQCNSTARYEFKNHFDQNGSRTSTEPESMQKFLVEMEKIHAVLVVENNGLKAELTSLKSLQKDVEQSLQSAKDSNEALRSELQESLERIRSFQTELDALRETKRLIEDQFENQKSINEDLDTQLTVSKVRLNEVSQKLSSLEVQLEDKSHCCEELEGTCLELQLQLESKGTLKDDNNQEEKLLQTGWEIKAASAKLAECEATILNLGNQLKALTSPKEVANPNKVLYNYRKSKQLNQRFSLLDQMLTEDDAGREGMTREIRGTTETKGHPIDQYNCQSAIHDSGVQLDASEAYIGPKDEEPKTALNRALVVIPKKKRGGGFSFLTKMLFRRKIRSSHKTLFPFSP